MGERITATRRREKITAEAQRAQRKRRGKNGPIGVAYFLLRIARLDFLCVSSALFAPLG